MLVLGCCIGEFTYHRFREEEEKSANLLSCSHIGWHVMEGFALQFIERPDEIPALLDTETLNSTCASWKSHASTNRIKQTEDSGV